MRAAFGAALGALVLFAMTARLGSQPAMLEFNYGYPTVDHVNIYVAQDLGLFEKVGLKPTFFTFASGAPLLAALKSESLDVATAGLGLAFAIGEGVPLKILFWTANDASGEGLVADPKSGIRSYRDLARPKKIAAATGTCAQVALYFLAKKIGVDYAKLDVVNIPAPLLPNALRSASVDAGIAWAPYSMDAAGEGFNVVNWDADYVPRDGDCPRTTAVRAGFLREHPEVGPKLVQVDALASAAVARNPQLALDALQKRLGLSPAVAKATFERVYVRRPTYAQQLDPSSPYSMTSADGGLAGKLFETMQAFADLKVIPAPVPMGTIRQAVDPSALKAFVASTRK